MSLKVEFETVDLILNSESITRGVDAFALSQIKMEKQMRRIFTFLVYQNPKLHGQYIELREALAGNRNVYFRGFMRGIETMYPIKIRDWIGKDFETLESSLLDSLDDRNKIFHGQITTKQLSTEELIQKIGDIKRWCGFLADSTTSEFGYDGFARNSMQLSNKDIYPKFLVRLESIKDYKTFINQHMVNEKKELPPEEVERLNKPYYQIDKQEVLRGIKLCLTNSKSQFNSSLKAEGENPGLANSLLILSAEECIKGFVLLAIFSNVQVPFLVKPIFKSHEAKHVRGGELHDFIRKLSLVIGAFSPQKAKQIKSVIGLVLEAITVNDDEVKWWDGANNAKNDGLYVSYDGQFQSPTQKSKESLKTSKGIVDRYISLLDKANIIVNKTI